MLYPPNQLDAVKDALVKYQKKHRCQGLSLCGVQLCLGPSTLDALGAFKRTELTPDS
jgi:hypothetical protein